MSLDPAVFAATQEAFAGFITKPKISLKLLSKPPFRYLHDIIMAVRKASGFFEGLFEESEMVAKAIKGKGPKITFLEKAVRCVGIANGSPLDVSLGKIVAGREADKTNGFLQAMARLARDTNVDKADCVRRTLAGENPGEGGAAASAPEPSKAAPAPEPSKQAPAPAPSPAQAPSKVPEPERAPSGGGGGTAGSGSGVHELLSAVTGEAEATRAAVNGIISKPKCSLKLLGKPPFRFLHDVITGIMQATNYHADLYSGDELNAKALKGKEPKTGFLKKIIACVEEDTGRPMDINPNKVVAGRESEKTCAFLHTLAVVATNADAFLAEKGNGDSNKAAAAAAAPANNEGKQSDDADAATREKEQRDEERRKEKARRAKEKARKEGERKAREAAEREAAEREAAERKEAERKAAKRKQAEEDAVREAAERKAAQRKAAERKAEEEASAAAQVPDGSAAVAAGETKQGGGGGEGKFADGPMPFEKAMTAEDALVLDGAGESKVEFQQAITERPQTKRLLRPSTARRRPPTIRQNVKQVEHKQEELHPDFKADGVMLEGQEDTESEDEAPEVEGTADASGASKVGADGEEHGRLVRDIMNDVEAQKAASKEGAEDGDAAADKAKDDGDNGGIVMGRIGSKAGGARRNVDVASLRQQIQSLCQSTNPLGKCIDYVHEDMAMMKKEYERWKADFDNFTAQTEAEVKRTEEELQPLTSELAKIEESIQEKRRQTNAVNASIARNDARIAELLGMVVSVHSGGRGTSAKMQSSSSIATSDSRDSYK